MGTSISSAISPPSLMLVKFCAGKNCPVITSKLSGPYDPVLMVEFCTVACKVIYHDGVNKLGSEKRAALTNFKRDADTPVPHTTKFEHFNSNSFLSYQMSVCHSDPF